MFDPTIIYQAPDPFENVQAGDTITFTDKVGVLYTGSVSGLYKQADKIYQVGVQAAGSYHYVNSYQVLAITRPSVEPPKTGVICAVRTQGLDEVWDYGVNVSPDSPYWTLLTHTQSGGARTRTVHKNALTSWTTVAVYQGQDVTRG